VLSWDTHTGKKLASFVMSSLQDVVVDVRFSADGNMIATCTSHGHFQIWDTKSGTELHRLDTPLSTGNGACTVAFSRDGQFLATSSSPSKSIQFWDVSSWRLRSKFDTPYGGAFCIANDPHNGAFAAVGNFGVKLWRRDIKREPESLLGHSAWVSGAAFSADGTLLVTGSSDNTVRIWDVTTGKERQKLEGSPVSPSFSPDHQWLLSNDSGASTLWDLRTGEKKATIISGRRDWLVVTPDGLFDGSPGAWNAVTWRFENSRLFDVLPGEAFFNEFFRPGLLGDILNGVAIPPPRALADLE
jgi:WD40 repeat protein